jgi:hypothetical protein
LGIAIRVTEHRKIAEISPGFSVYRLVKLETDEEEELPYLVSMDIEFQGGRFVCQSLTCKQRPDGEPVTSEGIRAIPVAQLIRRALVGNPFAVMHFKAKKDFVEMSPLDVPRDLTGQGPTDEALRYVALAYRFAYALGDAPTKGGHGTSPAQSTAA